MSGFLLPGINIILGQLSLGQQVCVHMHLCGIVHACKHAYIYIYIYIYISAVKVNNALTQIHFNGTNFINVRLPQRIFSV